MTQTTRTSAEYLDVVTNAVIDALGLDPEDVTPDSTLFDELGAESIDLLDIMFRVQRDTGVKVAAAEVEKFLRGGISEEDFSDAENHIVSDQGLTHLESVLPQFERSQLLGPLRAGQIASLLTVTNVADIVASVASASSVRPATTDETEVK